MCSFATPLFFLLFISTLTSYSQVGINTTSPTAMLDVNGNMRVRAMSEDFGSHLLTIDNAGYLTKARAFMLYNADEVLAAQPVSSSLQGSVTKNNIDLGLQAEITIPANREVKVIINYSVPMGTLTQSEPPSTYIGIRFLKNGNEEQQASRKLSLPYYSSPDSESISSMATLTNTYIENFTPGTVERNLTYDVKGYIEQHVQGSQTFNYKFNMWSASGANYNWGKASLSYQVYVK